MSPTSYGYFVDSKTYRVVKIHEHATSVRENPALFSVDPSAVAHLSPERDRRKLLDLVFARGWIRVRHRSSEVSVEFTCPWECALESVIKAHEGLGLSNLSFMKMTHLEEMTTLLTHLFIIQEHIAAGTLDELLQRKKEI